MGQQNDIHQQLDEWEGRAEQLLIDLGSFTDKDGGFIATPMLGIMYHMNVALKYIRERNGLETTPILPFLEEMFGDR